MQHSIASVLAMPGDQPEPIVVRLERRSATEMIAEFLREIAALILVFAPLDRFISEGQVSAEWLSGTLLMSFVLLLFGIVLEDIVESRRKEK